MSAIELLKGSEFSQRRIGPVSVVELTLANVEAARFPEHILCFLPDDESHTSQIWEGKAYPRKHWTIGSAAFYPSGSELTSKPDRPSKETSIRFHEDMLSRAAGGCVDMSKVDLQLADVTDPLIFSLASNVRRLASVEDIDHWPLLTESATLALAVSLLRKMSASGAAGLAPTDLKLGTARYRRVAEYVDANFHRRISLMEMAEVANLSQYHFCRMFHQQTGLSPLRYVLSRRVERARLLLLNPETSLVDVALACGFGGQSHFSTTFKTFIGVTPGEYRRNKGMVSFEV
uniref:HTH-type transcriptional activator RhaS n=1 Tax=Pseudomonas phage Touem01 TaxID=3138548 RepID=A0AAU6W2H7_9VIRU